VDGRWKKRLQIQRKGDAAASPAARGPGDAEKADGFHPDYQELLGTGVECLIKRHTQDTN
jgi:hypothetical protein